MTTLESDTSGDAFEVSHLRTPQEVTGPVELGERKRPVKSGGAPGRENSWSSGVAGKDMLPGMQEHSVRRKIMVSFIAIW
jgi:hypothetical protein